MGPLIEARRAANPLSEVPQASSLDAELLLCPSLEGGHRYPPISPAVPLSLSQLADPEYRGLPWSPQPATLLLIDRTEDLHTPTISNITPPQTQTQTQPLSTTNNEVTNSNNPINPNKVSFGTPMAHRILTTMSNPHTHSGIVTDVISFPPFSPSSSSSSSSTNSESFQNDTIEKLMNAFPALAALPLKIPMSLANLPICDEFNSSNNTNNLNTNKSEFYSSLRRVLFTCSEDEFCRHLCTLLKQQIEHNQGKLPPPKKRGLGAEVLALIQALTVSPGILDQLFHIHLYPSFIQAMKIIIVFFFT